MKGHPPTVRTVSEESENAEIISFHDDLRAGDFTYIIDADGEIHVHMYMYVGMFSLNCTFS